MSQKKQDKKKKKGNESETSFVNPRSGSVKQKVDLRAKTVPTTSGAGASATGLASPGGEEHDSSWDWKTQDDAEPGKKEKTSFFGKIKGKVTGRSKKALPGQVSYDEEPQPYTPHASITSSEVQASVGSPEGASHEPSSTWENPFSSPLEEQHTAGAGTPDASTTHLMHSPPPQSKPDDEHESSSQDPPPHPKPGAERGSSSQEPALEVHSKHPGVEFAQQQVSTEEKQKLETAIRDLQSELDREREEHKKTRDERVQWQSQHEKELEQAKKELEAEFSQQQMSTEEKLEATISNLHSELDQEREQHKKTRDERADWQSQHEKTKKVLEQAQNEYQAKFDKKERSIRSLFAKQKHGMESQIQEKTASIQDFEKRLEQLQDEKQRLEDLMGTTEEERDKAVEDKDALQLQLQIQVKQAAMPARKAEDDKPEGELQKLQQQLKDKEEEAEREKEKQHKYFQTLLQRQEKQVEAAKAQQEQAQKQVAELEEQMKVRIHEAEQQYQLAQLEQQRKYFQQLLNRQQKQAEAEAKKAELEEQIQQLREQMAQQLHDKEKECQAKVDEIENEKQQLKQLLEQQTKEAKVQEGVNLETQQLRRQMETALREKERELADAATRIKELERKYQESVEKDVRITELEQDLSRIQSTHFPQDGEKYKSLYKTEHERNLHLSNEMERMRFDLENRIRTVSKSSQREKSQLQVELTQVATTLRQKEVDLFTTQTALSTAREAYQQLQAQNQTLQQQITQQQVVLSQRAQGDELAPYIIPAFTMLEGGQFRGSGSYGSVHMVEVSGSPCIAKRLHDILVGRGNEEQISPEQSQSIQRKFRQECILLSRLRHPNIVQFIGVLQSRDPSDLTLVMECLHVDLDRCLRTYRNIPLPIKISILLDVSYGLCYLHSCQPSIIHRDLTAANILLTTDMRAKIADLGVSKILDLHPLRVSAHTMAPGTLAYMPPEACEENPKYDTKFDDFSFGVVTLYVANQKFPFVSERMTVTAVLNEEIQIKKRVAWIEMIPEPEQCLRPLIIHCLQDNPERRPTTAEITRQLKQLSEQHPKEFQDVLQMHSQISQLGQQVVSLQQEKEEIESELGQRIAEDVQRIPPQFVYTSTHTAEVSAAHVSPGYSQSSHEDSQYTQEHIPYDPNLVCLYCNKQFRMGEIQRFKQHVNLCGGN